MSIPFIVLSKRAATPPARYEPETGGSYTIPNSLSTSRNRRVVDPVFTDQQADDDFVEKFNNFVSNTEKKDDEQDFETSSKKSTVFTLSSRASSVISTTGSTRRKLQADLNAAKAKAKLDNERKKLDLERERLEKEKELIDQQLLIDKLAIDEETEEADDGTRFDRESVTVTDLDTLTRIENWRNGQFVAQEVLRNDDNQFTDQVDPNTPTNPCGQKSSAHQENGGQPTSKQQFVRHPTPCQQNSRIEDEQTGCCHGDPCTNSANQNQQINSKSFEEFKKAYDMGVRAAFESRPGDGNLGKFVARQSSARQLTDFSGDPVEWPSFISEFQESSTICSFTDHENMMRLKKCLKGKAREAVVSMFAVSSNVNRVIKTLEMNFGRPDLIVETLIVKAKEVPSPKDDKPEMMMDFSNAVLNLVATMESVKEVGHMSNPELMSSIVDKLPSISKILWSQFAATQKEKMNLKNLSDWLVDYAAAVIRTVRPKATTSRPKDVEEKRSVHQKYHHRETVLTTTDGGESTMECFFCNGKNHEIDECRKFKKESVKDHWTFSRENKLCFICLKKGHRTTDCPDKKKCGKDDCLELHHPLLHYVKKGKNYSRVIRAPEIVTHTRQIPKVVVLLKVLPVSLYGPKGTVNTYALLDEGSTVTLVDAVVADEIGATGPKSQLTIRGSSPREENYDSRTVTVSISGRGKKEIFTMNDVRTIQNMDLPVQSVQFQEMKKKWDHLKLINLDDLKDAKPTILIGSDNCELITTVERIQGASNAPLVSKTPLGLVAHGRTTVIRDPKISELVMNTYSNEEEDLLHRLVKQSFSTENFGVVIQQELPRSKDDTRSARIMESTTRRIGDRWETGLLWRDDNVKLPESYSNALNRLKSMERKMDRDPWFTDQYKNKIQELITKGYAKKLSPEEAAMTNDKTWYLPHFAVVNPNKPGKMRLVFDAAAKSHGFSLNDFLLIGPDLLKPLIVVFWNFRRKEHGFVADIREMFPMVRIIEPDWSAQRFLWRDENSRDRPPDVYVMMAMTFGILSSPSQAQFVKNKNAKEFEKEAPKAVKAITDHHYVDDYLDSNDSEKDGIGLIREVVEIHRRGGFELRNWISNSKNILKSIPPTLRTTEDKDLDLHSELPCERVLGIQWDPNRDEFKFNLKFNKVPDEVVKVIRTPTKREVLKLAMSIFDPLGFLAHFTIKIRILLQNIWRSKIGWDDELTQPAFQGWKIWLEELKEITKMRIPRCYFKGKITKRQLHIFCDASEQAFASVAYWRLESVDGIFHTSFIIAKTRVSPLKPMSIPRLELQAAVMASRLSITIIEGHREDKIESTHFWSDSRTVLLWLKSDARNFKPFVAHRVGEIQECTDQCTDHSIWHWVSTMDNVADEATRNNSECNLNPDSRWLNGPAFLRKPETEWPKEKIKNPSTEDIEINEYELKSQFVGVIRKVDYSYLPKIERFSKWLRLIRATAWLLRCRKRRLNPHEELMPIEMVEAENVWLKKVQEESFPVEINSLQKEKKLVTTSRLLKLCPFTDHLGILRIQGRTVGSQSLNNWTTQPVILEPKHPFTRLLLQYNHERAGHHGQEAIVNELRQKYWILDLRSAVKKTARNCQACKIKKSKPQPPMMSILPSCRVDKPTRPFTFVGMDYFGPFQVKIGRTKKKRYGVIFTCLSVRAVHLEIAESLSTDSAIMAIHRMVARRGHPTEIFSDNGRNFHGANNELKRALRDLDQNKIISTLTTKGIKWTFMPPCTPHMGGSWERLVRSVKVAMRAILKEQAPKQEVLETVFAEAERTVNSRPLTHVSSDPEDPESITPNHFLLGPGVYGSAADQVYGSFDDDAKRTRKQWRIAQKMADQFWKRWVREYLPTLTRRPKWMETTRPIKVGDLVMIIDSQFDRNQWTRGVVSATFPGRDGVVRVVNVTTNFGTYRRSVAKIRILDIVKE